MTKYDFLIDCGWIPIRMFYENGVKMDEMKRNEEIVVFVDRKILEPLDHSFIRLYH